LLYYLAAFNHTAPVWQVWLWMASFLVAGGAWLLSLRVVAHFWKIKLPSMLTLSAVCLPLTLPLPWLLWIHAQSPQGASLLTLKQAILVRTALYWNAVGTEALLNVVFFFLAVASLGLEFWLIKKTTAVTASRLLAVMGASLTLCLLAIACLASLAFWLGGFLM
jgi:hypothetical protein